VRHAALLFAVGALLGAGFAACSHTYRIPSSSMEPTIHCGRPKPGCLGAADDRVEIASVTPRALKRGEIVLFRVPRVAAAAACGEAGKYAKRLIGLPGETVAEQNGVIFIDGRRLREPYLRRARRDHQYGTWKVRPAHYFFLGDNRSESCDSRRFGAVPARNVLGLVTTIVRRGRRIRLR
jgi:signal peptidase I